MRLSPTRPRTRDADVEPGAAERLGRELADAERLVLVIDRELPAASADAAAPEPAAVDAAADAAADQGVTDEALVARVRAGDEDAVTELLGRYRALTGRKARSYFLAGADREDVVQEALIGLYKAVRDFDAEHEVSFRGFAEVCVTRQVLSAVKAATRHKHGPLNDYVSFSRPVAGADDGERCLADVLPSAAQHDPAEVLVAGERVRALQTHVDEVLSELETEVLRLWVEGRSYQEIAERLQRQVKAVDNALQRVKKKLEDHLRARTLAEAG